MPPDPDQTVERLLRRSLRPSPGPTADDDVCLDAETLAAWVDGGLNSKQQSLAETHLAACSRCQAMAAALAHSSAPVQVKERWWQHSWRLGWLVPLAAGAAAIALWVAVPRQSPYPPAPTESPADFSRAAGGQDVSANPPQVSRDQFAAPSQSTENDRQRADSSAGRSLKAAPPEEREARAESGVGSPKPPEQFAPAPPSALASAPPPAVPTSPAETLDSAAGLNRAAPSAQADAALSRSAAVLGPRPIESPDPNVRWRIGVPGVVQRSTDGGASWADSATGVAIELTAGVAPSASVCWMVGRQGTVLRTTDGRVWRRIPFPNAEDLVAVQAADANGATVTTADGRRFRTTDGGNSWMPAPLQEF